MHTITYHLILSRLLKYINNFVCKTIWILSQGCLVYTFLLLFIPGLFQKALSQSGTALKPWALTKYPGEQARRLGMKMNCPTNSTKEIVDCLKSVDGRDLVKVHLAVMVSVLKWLYYVLTKKIQWN